MTIPEGSGVAPSPDHHPRATNVLLRKPLTSVRAARLIATIATAVTVIPGVLMRVTDARQFPSAPLGSSVDGIDASKFLLGAGDRASAAGSDPFGVHSHIKSIYRKLDVSSRTLPITGPCEASSANSAGS